jgi:hypothetical protein
MKNIFNSLFLIFLCAAAINVNAQGFFDTLKKNFEMKPGGADAPITGSATADGSKNEAPTLEKCDKPIGTIAILYHLKKDAYNKVNQILVIGFIQRNNS